MLIVVCVFDDFVLGWFRVVNGCWLDGMLVVMLFVVLL